ncbi:MAG: extracellular solute-binding protein [Bacillota bacterium]
MKIRKFPLLMAAVMMLTLLMACASDKSPNADTASTADVSEDIATSDPDADKPAADKLYLCSPEKVTLSTFIAQQPSGYTDLLTNTFTTWLEEQTNVHLDMTIVPADGAKDKLILMFAGGDYPEIITGGFFSNADLMNYGGKEKILIPLNDLIDKHATALKERWAEMPQLKNDMTAPDGNIYGIPSLDSAGIGHPQCSYKMWMNMEWLKNLNLDVPTTTADFKKVLMAFKNDDPNGNGKADEIPLTGAINTWNADPYKFILNAFDYFDFDTLLKLKDGKISFTANTDGFREGLRYMADLYANGLIDPAAFTQNEQQMSAIGNNEDVAIVGACGAGHLGMLVGVNFVERMKEYDNILPLQGPNGYRGIPYNVTPRVSGAAFAITDKCPAEKQEVAIKWADLFCREEIVIRAQIGIQGKNWDVADPGTIGIDGKTTASYKYLTFSSSGEVATQNDIWGWTMRLIEPDWKNKFQFVGDIYDPTNYEARLLRATVKLQPYAADVEQIPPFFLSTDDSARIAQIFAPLQDYVKTSIVEFITGKKNVDRDWDAYIAGLSKLKYEEYVRLNQAAYDNLTK